MVSFQIAKGFGYRFNIVWRGKSAHNCLCCSKNGTGVDNSEHCLGVPKTFGRHCRDKQWLETVLIIWWSDINQRWQVNLLGVTTNSKVNFNKYILHLCSKVNIKVSAYSRIRKYLHYNQADIVCKSKCWQIQLLSVLLDVGVRVRVMCRCRLGVAM